MYRGNTTVIHKYKVVTILCCTVGPKAQALSRGDHKSYLSMCLPQWGGGPHACNYYRQKSTAMHKKNTFDLKALSSTNYDAVESQSQINYPGGKCT